MTLAPWPRIGQLIDSSIVVLENIYRMRGGVPPSRPRSTDERSGRAIAVGASRPASSSCDDLHAGMSGHVQAAAYVVSFANLMGCSWPDHVRCSRRLIRVVKPIGADAKKPLSAWRGSSSRLPQLENWYKRLLHKALDHRVFVLAPSQPCSSAAVPIRLVGNEFMPATTDESGHGRDGGRTRLEVMDRTFSASRRCQGPSRDRQHEESFGGALAQRREHGNMTSSPARTSARVERGHPIDLRGSSPIPGTSPDRASGADDVRHAGGGAGASR